MKKYFYMFLKHTCNCIRGYAEGLVPRIRVVQFTNPCCRRMVSISKEWMGEIIKSEEYELKALDPKMIRWQKENIPHIQKNILEYEERLKEVESIADKTAMNRI